MTHSNPRRPIKIIILFLLFIYSPSFAGEQSINYSWGTKPLETAYWGMAIGDDVVLLERRKINIGHFLENNFMKDAECSFPGQAEGAKVFLANIDDDKENEIIVSAVEDGVPSSFALDYKNKSCTVLFQRIRKSLRVIEYNNDTLLVGQGWSQSSFFSGPIFTLKYQNGKLLEDKKIEMPWDVDLYQFTFKQGENQSVLLSKGYAPLELYEKGTKKFKRVWRSGYRFGGSINLLPASEREALDEESAQFVTFDTPPIFISDGNMIALRHDLPVKGVIGQKPVIRSGHFVGFKPDPVLGFVETFKGVEVPGAIIDVGSDGKNLLLLILTDAHAFREGTTSQILSFDVHP